MTSMGSVLRYCTGNLSYVNHLESAHATADQAGIVGIDEPWNFRGRLRSDYLLPTPCSCRHYRSNMYVILVNE